MKIPLTKMMRHYRERSYQIGHGGKIGRKALSLWSYFASRPALYRTINGLTVRLLRLLAFGRGGLPWLPFAGGWTKTRDLPVPEGVTFMEQYRREQGK